MAGVLVSSIIALFASALTVGELDFVRTVASVLTDWHTDSSISNLIPRDADALPLLINVTIGQTLLPAVAINFNKSLCTIALPINADLILRTDLIPIADSKLAILNCTRLLNTGDSLDFVGCWGVHWHYCVIDVVDRG